MSLAKNKYVSMIQIPIDAPTLARLREAMALTKVFTYSAFCRSAILKELNRLLKESKNPSNPSV